MKRIHIPFIIFGALLAGAPCQAMEKAPQLTQEEVEADLIAQITQLNDDAHVVYLGSDAIRGLPGQDGQDQHTWASIAERMSKLEQLAQNSTEKVLQALQDVKVNIQTMRERWDEATNAFSGLLTKSPF